MNDSLRFRVRPWALLSLAGLVAVLATLLGFLGQLYWSFDLFSHFRVQYLFGLSVIAALLCIPRQWKQAGLFAGFALVNLLLILPLYFGRGEVQAGATSYRVVLINVNTERGDPRRVMEFVRELDPDVLVLEEVNESWMTSLAPLREVFSHAISEPRADNFGIALMSRLPLQESKVLNIGEAGVPSIACRVETRQGGVSLFATHPLPPKGPEFSRLRNQQLAEIPQHLGEGPLLLIGDLNVTPWSPYFRKLLEASRLRDSAKGFGVQPTWPQFNLLMGVPIDHVLHSPEIVITDRYTGPPTGSDHLPLVVDFQVLRPE